MTTGIVVLCDVRASREIPDRTSFVHRLMDVLDGVNRKSDQLIGTFESQAGLDEFAGVLQPGRAASVLPRLWEDLHPFAVRCAAVRGALDVIPESDDRNSLPSATGFDGPAFHRASGLLDELRGSQGLVAIHIGAEHENRLLTALGELLYAGILEWTDRQLEIVRTYRKSGSQRAAAGELGVSQSTVSRALAAANHRRINAARTAFVETFNEISRRPIE